MAAGLLLAACSSSGGTSATGHDASSGGASSSGAASAALAAAKATYDQYVQIHSLESVPALPSAPPKGKTVTILTCNIPTCATAAAGAKAAAEAVGWIPTVLQDDSTPQGYTSLMNQVAANPPDALIYIPALPDSSIQPQLARLQAAGTKIVEESPLGDPLATDGPVKAVVLGQADGRLAGEVMGRAVDADANGPTKAVFVWDPSFSAGWGPVKDGFTEAVESVGGSVGVLPITVQNIGKQAPSQIVSYLQAHPDTKYIATPAVDYQAGLDPALQAAGLLGKVKVISRATNQATLAAIKDGTDWAGVAIELASGGWRGMDQAIRLVMGLPLGSRASQTGWEQIYVKSNV
ncbi:MAG: substrate-binding domain-containing protein, partial [Actinobacteria bacterium]|nr:substrate-binding domain-containing protein [Actinomycetota bacterium]